MHQLGHGNPPETLINAKYRAKIEDFANHRADMSQSEVEQQFLFYCHELAALFDAQPPSSLLRQAAWRWLTEGPHEAKRYAKL